MEPTRPAPDPQVDSNLSGSPDPMRQTVYLIMHDGRPLHVSLGPKDADRLLALEREAALYSGSNREPYIVEMQAENLTAPAGVTSEKHTPGPWEISKHGHGALQLEDEYGIYPPVGERGPVSLVSGEANAQFIAEAKAATDEAGMSPTCMVQRIKELEEALKNLLRECDYQASCGNMNEHRIEFDQARTVLNKK